MIIRTERRSDYAATEFLTREAFYNVYAPGCDEHYLLHVLHGSDVLIPELSLVAELDGAIIGHALLTQACIRNAQREIRDVLCLGPICAAPDHQKKGVGGALIGEAAKRASQLGYRAILLYGNPEYYTKKGFVPAERYGIHTPDGMYADALHAMALYPGALDGAAGAYSENEIFAIDSGEARAFDAQFPPKEKIENTPSQLRFHEILKLRRPVK